MSDEGARWVSPTQFRCIDSGLRVLTAWTAAPSDPADGLDRAVTAEPDRTAVVVGLAAVARLLAIELAAATGTTEHAVIGDLTATVCLLQNPVPAAPPGAPARSTPERR